MELGAVGADFGPHFAIGVCVELPSSVLVRLLFGGLSMTVLPVLAGVKLRTYGAMRGGGLYVRGSPGNLDVHGVMAADAAVALEVLGGLFPPVVDAGMWWADAV